MQQVTAPYIDSTIRRFFPAQVARYEKYGSPTADNSWVTMTDEYAQALRRHSRADVEAACRSIFRSKGPGILPTVRELNIACERAADADLRRKAERRRAEQAVEVGRLDVSMPAGMPPLILAAHEARGDGDRDTYFCCMHDAVDAYYDEDHREAAHERLHATAAHQAEIAGCQGDKKALGVVQGRRYVERKAAWLAKDGA